MITDKDRIDFLQRCIEEGKMTCFPKNFSEPVRKQIDGEMMECGEGNVTFYCKCGVGYDECDDMDGLDANLLCVHSTDVIHHPNGDETWHSTYKCRFCGEEFTVEEGN